MGRPAKCRYCQNNLKIETRYQTVIDNKTAYFCNEEHFLLFKTRSDEEKQKKEENKDKAYWLICEIINRKEIINTVLWKQWKMWNKVASNEVIAKYLEENKEYLISVISKLDDIEHGRILYLSAILRNNLGDFIMKNKTIETPKPKVQVEEYIYEPEYTGTRSNKRRSLVDLEDEF